MPTIQSSLRLALTTAALCAAASTADARARRVVVLDFDGPRQLAAASKSSVVSVLGAQYDVVATKRWVTARVAAAISNHGPAQWSRAAKQSGVDAVIEGWVQDEGRHKVLNVVVRVANTGREFDTISVRLDGKAGMSLENTRQLQTSLDEVLDWIDPGHNETAKSLPVIEISGPPGAPEVSVDDGSGGSSRGRRTPSDQVTPAPRPRHPASPASDEAPARTRGARTSRTEDDPAVEAAPRRRTKQVPADSGAPSDVPASQPGDDDGAGPPPPTEASYEAKPAQVSTADREVHELEILFPQGTVDRTQLLGPKADHVPEKTPRFMADVGGWVTSRSVTWTADPEANVPQFAGVSSKGLQVNAAAYPFPRKEIDGTLSGFGFTASLYHSLGSTVISDEGDTINEYVINQNGWEFGAHYRAPISSLVTLDGGVFYGNQTYEIVDASVDFETPDTKYSLLGADLHLDLAITDRARIGFGARYFTVLDAGDLASTEFFGPVNASGLGLDATFLIPLPANLYVRGTLAYQKISLETSGGGIITDDEGVTDGSDSTVTGNLNIGVAF